MILECLAFTQYPVQHFPFHTLQYVVFANVAVLKHCSHLMTCSMAAALDGSQCKSGIHVYKSLPQRNTILARAHAKLADLKHGQRMPVCPWFYLVFVLGSKDIAKDRSTSKYMRTNVVWNALVSRRIPV
jgi:hypothetical protein